MPKMFITHNVADVDRWLSFKEERANSIGAMGASNVTDYAAQDGSNTVAIGANVEDMTAVMAGLASPPPELQDLMERHGVLPPIAVYVEK